MAIRPRIFLEGNFFLDVSPGSPSAHDLGSGDVIPIAQTSTAVQLDQILTSLQAPDRANLQKLLEGYGTALTHKPSAKDDATQDPEVQGLTAAEAINKSFVYGATAARDSAIVNEALQGTAPHDLSNLIAGLARVFGALSSHESQLQGVVTNLNTFTGALASESANLQRSIKLLGPTLLIAEPALRHTNSTLPFLRAFARDLTPGIKELPATIAASQPWLDQTAALLSKTSSATSRASCAPPHRGPRKAADDGRGLFSQIGQLSGCVDNVLIPTSNVVLNDSGSGYNFTTGQPNYREFAYGTTGLAGESQDVRRQRPDAAVLLRRRRRPGRRPGAQPAPGRPGRQWTAGGALGRLDRAADRHQARGRLRAAVQDRRRLPEQRDPRPQRARRGHGPDFPPSVPMRRALRAHIRDVLAIVALVLAGLFAVTVILINQRATLPELGAADRD